MIGGLMKTTSYLAIAAAAGLMFAGATLAPKAARAADLGGDCCADLEGRVAELEATTVRKGNKKVSLTISGRVAASMTLFWDNSGLPANAGNGAGPITTDSKSDLYFGGQTGNDPAIFLDGTGKIDSDRVAGYHIELDYNFQGSNSQNTRQQGTAWGTNTDAYVYINSKSLGKVQLGRMNGVLDDWDNVGFAGGYIDGTLNIRSSGAFFLRDSAGANSGITYGGLRSGIDTGGDVGLKYISPVFGNWVTLATHVGGDSEWDIGALLSGNLSKSVAVKFAAAYSSATEGDALTGGAQAANNQNGSARRLNLAGGIQDSSSGLFAQATYGVAYADGNAAATTVTAATAPTLTAVAVCPAPSPSTICGLTPPTLITAGALASGTTLTHLNDITTWTVFGGWHKNVTGMGNTEIFTQYLKSNNNYADGASTHVWQVGIDQAIDSASSHLFLTYENYNADSLPAGLKDGAGNTIGTQDLSTITAGMSITF